MVAMPRLVEDIVDDIVRNTETPPDQVDELREAVTLWVEDMARKLQS